MISLAPTDAIRRIGLCSELGLDTAAFLFLPVLVLVPRGITPLAAVAGVLATGLMMSRGTGSFRVSQWPAMLLAALLVWGTISASWSVIPDHSLIIAARLGGLVGAGLALTMAADAVAFPRRLLFCFYVGLAVALLLALIQFATGGCLTRPFLTRGFSLPQLNQAADTLAILLFPASATLLYRDRARLPLLLTAAIVVVICILVGTAAKIALGAGVAFASLLYISPRRVARAAAILSALVIITAPLTFSRLARIEVVAEMAEGIKFSAWHRLMIWSFAGDRIAERPLIGWGLDASRAIPGGEEPIYEGRVWMPLHPHNAAIQVWLELGVPGATLLALVVAWLWLRLADLRWPRLFTAATGASLGTASVAAIAAYGIWQEWWISTLWLSLFLIVVMARCIPSPAPCSAAT